MESFLAEPALILEIAVLALALLWDLILGEPPKGWHPVTWMGKATSLLEGKAPKQGRKGPFLYGLGMALVVPVVFALGAYLVSKGLTFVSGLAYVVVGGYLLKGCFAVRALEEAASRVGRRLEANQLDAARQELTSLVSRDTSALTPDLAASAAVESVAENTTDSFVAPWLAFALFGLPGAFAYRAINTLDSMIGYHGPYEYLGKASARLDDLLNLIPARLAAMLLVVGAFVRGLDARRAWRTLWRQHSRTESPNAGWTMSAMAGALGIELQKVGHYRLGAPLRPLEPKDIKESIMVARWIAAFSFLLTLGLVVMRYVVF